MKGILNSGKRFGGIGLVLLLLLGMASAAQATDRYVAAGSGLDTGDCSVQASPCLTIQYAIDQSTAGDTIHVGVGLYAEDISIGKSITLEGAQAGTPANASRSTDPSDASIVMPATQTNPTYGGAGGVLLGIGSDDVVVDGFVFDGDNPSLASGLDMHGADPDVAIGMTLSGSNIKIRNNVVRNLVFAGIYAFNYPTNTVPAGTGNVIKNNFISNMDAPSDWGIGIVAGYNFYVDIDSNVMEDVRIGVQTNYFNKAAPAGTDAFIRNNDIDASAMGIYFHYFAQNSSPFTVKGNQVTGHSQTGQTDLWNGISVSSFYYDSLGYVQDNVIDGSGLAGSGRQRAGYRVVLITTSQSADLAIEGGTVSNVDDGVFVTDGAYYPGAVDNIDVRNVAFSNVDRAAFYVEDTALAGSETTDFAPKVTVGAGNTYTNVAWQGALSGPQATIAFAAGVPNFDTVLVRSANGGHRAGEADSNGNVRSVDDAIINDGIAIAAPGGTVDIEAGTFEQSVRIEKSVTVQGPFAGVAGYDASRGTGEAILSPASGRAVVIGAGYYGGPGVSNVTLDGFTITGQGGSPLDVGGMAAIWGGMNHHGGKSDHVQIINNRVLNISNGNGLYTSSTPGDVQSWTVAHNLFQDITYQYGSAINLWDVTGTNLIADNHISNIGWAGIQAVDAANVVIKNNIVTSTGSSGISVGQTPVGPGSSNIQVFGNSITDANTDAHANQGGLNASGQNSNVVMMCNSVSGSGTNGFATAGSGSISYADLRVFDNAFDVAADLAHTVASNITIGSNWYGGSSPTIGGSNSAGVMAAAELAATPIGTPICNNPNPATANNAAAVVIQSGSGQSTTINTAFANDLVVRVEDALGGAVAGVTVTFAAPASGASATLGTASGSTNFNGVVSTSATANGVAGSYNVTASSASLTPVSFALTNSKVPGTVVWDTTSFVYDGNAHVPTAHLAEESGATCTFTPASVGPDAGTYPVSTSCQSANYSGSGNATVTIAKATAGVSLSHLVQPYDGAPKSVLVTTTPAGLGYSVVYEGTGGTTYGPSSYPPVQVGSYTATVTIVDNNYVGSGTGTLQIVPSNGDIALVVTGPVDPVHVDDKAQFAATMLANPDLHQGETYAYKLVLSKSGGNPLALSDIGSMEVYYQGSWVDFTPMLNDPSLFQWVGGNLVYYFPDGFSAYPNGFPILDPVWTWNTRFSMTTTGTYTVSWELVDGTNHAAPVTPAVAGSASVVVQPPLPPTDIHLVMGGPVDSVQANTPVAYTATMLAEPSQHQGELFYARIRLAKVGGTHALKTSDFNMEVYYLGAWHTLDTNVFQPDGNELVYDFPSNVDPAGFEITSSDWTWNYRITYADTGTYTMTAKIIHAADASMPNPPVFASDATSTTVTAQLIDAATSITDNRDYVKYGDDLQYFITVDNVGDADLVGVNVSDVLPPLLINGEWSCTALGTASCAVTSGTGDISTTVDLPAGGGVLFTLDAEVNGDPSLTTDQIINQVTVSVPNDGNSANDTAIDTTQAVIFRDGFEINSNGAQRVLNAVVAPDGVLSLNRSNSEMLGLDAVRQGRIGIVELARVRAGADRVAVEAMHVRGHLWVRLAGRVNGKRVMSDWAEVSAERDALAIAMVASGKERALILVGADKDLEARVGDGHDSMTLRGPEASD